MIMIRKIRILVLDFQGLLHIFFNLTFLSFQKISFTAELFLKILYINHLFCKITLPVAYDNNRNVQNCISGKNSRLTCSDISAIDSRLIDLSVDFFLSFRHDGCYSELGPLSFFSTSGIESCVPWSIRFVYGTHVREV